MVIPIGDIEKTRIVPVVTYLLIALNTLVYLYQQARPESFTVAFAATPYEITHNIDLDGSELVELDNPRDPLGVPERVALSEAKIPQARVPFPVWFTLLTSMFLHGSPLHLAGNMLYLWIFGDNVEEVLGSLRYLLVYLACGLVGSLAQIMATPNSLIPSLGASGAVAGMMGAYLVWFPLNRVRVLVFAFILEMPALVMIGAWILLQLFVTETTRAQVGQRGGVAYMAHVGGAFTGIITGLLYRRRGREMALRNSARNWPKPT
jgi:membrane associated rhomboid family serine protease